MKPKVSNWRRRVKELLVKEHGSKCKCCGYEGPAFHFDFDHREPKEKSFRLSEYRFGIEKLREEAKKCDLLCAICHRTRTHMQQCPGCEFCDNLEAMPNKLGAKL